MNRVSLAMVKEREERLRDATDDSCAYLTAVDHLRGAEWLTRLVI